MIAGIIDTHALIWYLNADKRLSANAKQFVDSVGQAGNEIGVPTLALVEIQYLVEKGRIPPDTLARIITVLQSSDTVFIEIPLSIAIVQVLPRVPWSDVPDMPDRIIAATAVHLNVPVISRDSKIQSSSLITIW